jgi:hypothetical protein
MTDRGKLARFKLKQKLSFKLAIAPFLCFILSKINVVTTGQVTVGQMTIAQMTIGQNAYW